jgi:hypothetical protein
MGYFGLMLILIVLAAFFFALIAMIILAVASLVIVGSGATAVAAGGLAGAARIKDRFTKMLTILVCSTVLLFAICCFLLLASFFFGEYRTTLFFLGIISGLVSSGLGVLGLVNTRKVEKKSLRILFIVLFSIALFLGLVAVGIYILALRIPGFTLA